MNRSLIWITLLAFVLGAVLPFSPTPSTASAQAIVTGPLTAEANEYVVLYADGASLASARAAVKAAGGTIVRENAQVGVATVHADAADFQLPWASSAPSPGSRATRRSATRRRRRPPRSTGSSTSARARRAASPAKAPSDGPQTSRIRSPISSGT